jgi:PhnB protein
MPGQFYLFVKDPDAMVERAVQHGATQVMKVNDVSYGDRQGGVKDVEGNIWWISKHIKEEPYPQEHD